MQGTNPVDQKNVSSAKTPGLSWSQPAAVSTPVSQKPPAAPPKAPMTALMPPSYGRGAVVGSFVAGVIVGSVAGWMFLSPRDGAPASGTASSTSSIKTTQENAVKSQNTLAVLSASTLTVASQAAGLKVAVSGVVVTEPTWVVVYENRNGELGNVLGAKLFFPKSQGGASTGSVTLLRTTHAGQTYFAGLHVDNGDGKFSKQTDTMTDNTVSFKAN